MEQIACITTIVIVAIYGILRRPNFKNKNELTITYPDGPFANWQRNLKEKKILKAGFNISSEEKIK